MPQSATLTRPAPDRLKCPAWCTNHESDETGEIHATTAIPLPSGGSVWLKKSGRHAARIVVDAAPYTIEDLSIPHAVALAAAVTALTVLIQGVTA